MREYPIIYQIFQHYDAEMSAAEAQGMATAMLCVNPQAHLETWLAEIFKDEPQFLADDKQELSAWFTQTRTWLSPDDSSFEFDLCLPTEVNLTHIAQAISDWCQGFLTALGYFGQAQTFSREVHGILQDMIELTKLDTAIEDTDENEAALMEIQQYLRAAVFLMVHERHGKHEKIIH